MGRAAFGGRKRPENTYSLITYLFYPVIAEERNFYQQVIQRPDRRKLT